MEEAAPGVAAVQVGTPRKTATATSKDNKQHFVAADLLAYGNRKKMFPPCCLCELLGDPMGNAHTHSLDFCFANPMSQKDDPVGCLEPHARPVSPVSKTRAARLGQAHHGSWPEDRETSAQGEEK